MTARLAGSWIGYHARASPDRTALHDLDGGQRLSYAELDDRIGRAAGALAGRFGVRPGDRVAMLSRNCSQAFEVMYACARLGAIFVPLNVRLSDPELDTLAGDAAPALLVGEHDLLGRDVAADRPRMSWEDGCDRPSRPAPANPVLIDPDDPWVIIYTSGTTGRPKGVLVTHAGSDATMLAGVMGAGVTRESVCLAALPVWHVAGLNLFANPTLFAGGTCSSCAPSIPGSPSTCSAGRKTRSPTSPASRPTTSSCRHCPSSGKPRSPAWSPGSADHRSRPRLSRTGGSVVWPCARSTALAKPGRS